ncbi:NAD(P)H-binding protein [Streptomyces sp. NPDC005438]|uniref:SDR family oxidoreductase n=1 Tax=Streptomyces sp. NPDC005438 TaxID=3156880 RepID=UPI0033A235A5
MSGLILVTGGTGTLGRAVVRELLERGERVRVLSRNPRPTGDDRDCEWATGDLDSGVGIEAAVAGADVVVHCATSFTKGDEAGARRVIECARQADRKPHLVYISIVGIDRVPMPYYKMKRRVEELFEESGLAWTILRTTQFHNLLARITLSQRWLPFALAFRAPFQPIEVDEVAARLAELAVAAPAGRVADMGGPQVVSGSELARRTLRAAGRRRLVVPLRLPGRAFRAVRDGALLAPEQTRGSGTFEEFLSETVRV